jgi:hypothetical protein
MSPPQRIECGLVDVVESGGCLAGDVLELQRPERRQGRVHEPFAAAMTAQRRGDEAGTQGRIRRRSDPHPARRDDDGAGNARSEAA